MDIFTELIKCINGLNEVESYCDTISAQQSEIDSALSDLYHHIENNTLNASQSCKIIKEIRKQRQLRRNVMNNLEISKTLRTHSAKLNNKDNREMLLHELNKTNNNLNQPYKNRIYTEEELRV